MQTVNDFSKPTKIIIILRVTKLNPIVTEDLVELIFNNPSNIPRSTQGDIKGTSQSQPKQHGRKENQYYTL